MQETGSYCKFGLKELQQHDMCSGSCQNFRPSCQGRLPDVFTHVLVSYVGILYPHWSKIDD